MVRDRLKVETVNPTSGPRIRRVSEASPSQTMSLDTGLNSFFGFERHGLGLGPPSPTSINSDPGYLSSLHCNNGCQTQLVLLERGSDLIWGGWEGTLDRGYYVVFSKKKVPMTLLYLNHFLIPCLMYFLMMNCSLNI